ncbi:MAG: phosphoserine phosphatase [Solirubrobacteraceae bacterium]|jgi:broad specificity phosphatase PhoE|nr:phosphoserine phosphatase [Solirubrobacteraceae bacterium]
MPEIRLLRHAETTGYAGDLGLSERGTEQAAAAAAALAAELGAGATLGLRHAPSVRARVTAEVLAADLLAAGVEVDGPRPDAGFANFAVAADGEVREQAEVFGEHADAAERPFEDLPGWLGDIARFRAVHVGGGDPIGFWLTTPLLGFEPPAVAVRRYWRALRTVEPGRLTVVAAHSGPMRALVAHAFARDLGEPENLEAVAVELDGDGAEVRYRGETAAIAVPGTTEPAWW